MSRALLLAGLFVAAAPEAAAAAKGKPKKAPAPLAAPAVAEPAAAAPLPLPPPPKAEVATATLLTGARAALEGLEYGQAYVLSEALVQRQDATRAMQVEGWWVQGQAIAVLRDPVEAEPAFRTLLRLDPGFEPPSDPGPKILAAFLKVQVEERALAERLARDARARLIEGLSLTGEVRTRARGGRPLPFAFRLKDPTGAVDELKVAYRLKGTGAPFSALALVRASDGRYAAEVPGEVTANGGGATLEYFVEAVDARGVLLQRGDAQTPLAVELTAGDVGKALPRAWYHGALTATLVSTAATLGLGAAALVAERSHAALATPMPMLLPGDNGISSQDWKTSQLTAERLIASTLIGVGVTAIFAIVTVVLSRYVEQADSPD